MRRLALEKRALQLKYESWRCGALTTKAHCHNVREARSVLDKQENMPKYLALNRELFNLLEYIRSTETLP